MLAELARVYWYTVEFGLVSQPDGLRIYGSGILSSSAETRFALEDSSPHRVRFALPRVMRTRYRIDDFQEVYFVLDNLTQPLDLAQIDFMPVYGQIAGLPALDPGELAAGDQIIRQGTGAYHRGRQTPRPASARQPMADAGGPRSFFLRAIRHDGGDGGRHHTR